MTVSDNFDENVKWFESAFEDCGDIVSRIFPVGHFKQARIFVIYIDNMADSAFISLNVMENFMMGIREVSPEMPIIEKDIYEALRDGGLTVADISESETLEEAALSIMSGDMAVFIEFGEKALIVSSKGFLSRGVTTAETEVVVQGSKEAFSEVIRTNTCLIRRRIRDINLKVKQLKIGRRSQTDIALVYLKGIVREDILAEVLRRLKGIDIDALPDSGYIEQLIADDWKSPFPQGQMTERPDTAAAAILEGRIAIIVDNSPFALLVPVTLNTFFQSAEDYYQHFAIMSFMRIMRFIAGAVAMCLPALYIALTSYHPSMIPMFLTFKMAGSRQGVPLPAFGEIIIMDLAFELLREAGIRLPNAMGGAIGIVGGLIVGQAAVEAGFVSPVVVIVIAITGIAGFTIPHNSLVGAFRLLKYLLIILSAMLGLFGFWLGLLAVLIHLVSLRSFGIPYMFPFTSGEANGGTDIKDSLLRFPIFSMKKRPIFASPGDLRRMNNNPTTAKDGADSNNMPL